MSWIIDDQIGSPVAVLDAAGTLASAVEFWPGGAPRWTGGPVPLDSFGDAGFAGSTRSGWLPTGTVSHLGARDLDLLTGLWLQPDPILPTLSNPQSLNRYTYVLGNPLKYTDPTRHCGVLPGVDDWDCFVGSGNAADLTAHLNQVHDMIPNNIDGRLVRRVDYSKPSIPAAIEAAERGDIGGAFHLSGLLADGLEASMHLGAHAAPVLGTVHCPASATPSATSPTGLQGVTPHPMSVGKNVTIFEAPGGDAAAIECFVCLTQGMNRGQWMDDYDGLVRSDGLRSIGLRFSYYSRDWAIDISTPLGPVKVHFPR